MIGNFFRQLPKTGRPANFRAVVHLLHDADHLCIGATLHDPEPTKAITAGKDRDFLSSDSDLFGVVLDTCKDRRNSCLFPMLPAGAMPDEQTYNDSRTIVEAWEGVWKVRTLSTDSSCTVAMMIPLRTLRFDATRPPQERCMNFIRRVRRTRETSEGHRTSDRIACTACPRRHVGQ